MFYPPNLPLTERFAQLITGLCGSLSQQSSTRSFTTGPLLLMIWNRWCRMRTRFTSLVARMLAGTLRAPAPRVRRVRAASPRPPATPDQPRLPSPRFGWVLPLCPEYWHVNAWRVPLQELLADPQTIALVAAGPQAGRILRPLCRMVGMELPDYLRLPPRPRRPRPPRPRRPLTQEQHDARVRRMGRLAFAQLINPEVDGKPNGTRPPNRIGYGRPKPFPKPDSAG